MICKTILTVLMLMTIGIAPVLLSNRSHSAQAQTAANNKPTKKVNRYACPMHPEVRSTRRGKCPQCGMTMRVVKAEAPPITTPIPTPTPSDLATASADTGGPSASTSSLHIPDVEVYDQHGNRLKFNSDLIKDKTVAINFIFTTCTTICGPLTATFQRTQQEIIAQELSVQFISISVDPMTDTPERLRVFAAKFKAKPGWTFVTGDKAAIDSILQALGAAVAVKTDHSPMVLIGNEKKNYWTRTYGLSSPSTLFKVILEAANK